VKRQDSFPDESPSSQSPGTLEQDIWIKVPPPLKCIANYLASQIGIDSFIVKPYEKLDLIEKIQTLVNG
jgi:hypothetical protein